jgi:hypothetical protein
MKVLLYSQESSSLPGIPYGKIDAWIPFFGTLYYLWANVHADAVSGVTLGCRFL